MMDKDDPRLTAYALGELDATEAASVEAALADDAQGQAEVTAIRQTAAVLREALAAEAAPALTDEQREAIRMRAARGPRATRWPVLRVLTWTTAAAAAALAVTFHFLPRWGTRLEPHPAGTTLGRTLVTADESLAGAKSGAPRGKADNFSAARRPARAEGPDAAPRELPLAYEPRSRDTAAETARLLPGRAPAAAAPTAASRVESVPTRAPGLTEHDLDALRTVPPRADPAIPVAGGVLAAADAAGVAVAAAKGPGGGMAAAEPAAVTQHAELARPRGTLAAPAMAAPAAPATPEVRLAVPPAPGMPPGTGQDWRWAKTRAAEAEVAKAAAPELAKAKVGDVAADDGSYGSVRRLLRDGQLPPPEAVHVSALVNSFQYQDSPPAGEEPLTVRAEVATCPWRPVHQLVRVAVKGREAETDLRVAAAPAGARGAPARAGGEFGGTEVIAMDATLQVDFVPARVSACQRLAGSGMVTAATGLSDVQELGGIPVGYSLSTFYEIVPVAAQAQIAVALEARREQAKRVLDARPELPELLTVRLRWTQPETGRARLLTVPVPDEVRRWEEASEDMRFGSAVALFGMNLRNSPEAARADLQAVLEMAAPTLVSQRDASRTEFLDLVRKAQALRTPNATRAGTVTEPAAPRP